MNLVGKSLLISSVLNSVFHVFPVLRLSHLLFLFQTGLLSDGEMSEELREGEKKHKCLSFYLPAERKLCTSALKVQRTKRDEFKMVNIT